MKQKLSAVKFIRNNKRQVFVMITAVALTFMAMYVMNFILMVTEESFEVVLVQRTESISFADISYEDLIGEQDAEMTDEEAEALYQEKTDALIEKLKEQDGIDDVYYTQVLNAGYYAVLGQLGYYIPLLSPEQIPDYLEHMDARLVDGKLPEGDGEIAADRRLMMNNHYQIGDYFLEESFGKTFQIVGILESDDLVCAGTPNGYTNNGWQLVVLNDENTTDLRSLLADAGCHITDEDSVIDMEYGRKVYEREVADVVDAALSVILFVVVVFLAISVFVAYISFMRNRVNEWCLYMSIGYSREDIYGMIMRELLAIFGISLVLGSILSCVMMAVLKALVVDPMGLYCGFWYPGFLMKIIAAFVFIIGGLQLPVIVVVQSIKTIDRMED